MSRSLTILCGIGITGMALVAMMGSVFVSKVGGAENVESLTAEMARIYGARMEDPAALRVVVVSQGEATGLRISFTPSPDACRRPADLDRCLQRMASWVFDRQSRRKAVEFVSFSLSMPDGSTVERRVDRS